MKKNEDDSTSIIIQHSTNTHRNNRFQMINSPEIFTRVNAVKSTNEKKSSLNAFRLNNLLDSKRGPNVRKINAHRQTYRQIKQKIAKTLAGMQFSKSNLSLSEVMIWKQEVLASFMNEYLLEIEKECKEKADILLFIWNSVFNIIDWLFEVVGKLSKQEEKDYLSNLIDNHKSYQNIIDNLHAKLAKREQQYARQEEFIKALVYNLRFKRKEIKKLSKNLKVCTFRLNEIKDFYLDLQVEHIELLSQNRDISKQNAKNLIKRKQEINHQKRKEFKLKQSHKKIRFQIQNEILYENAKESENVGKLNEELQVKFQKYYDSSKNTGQKISYPSAQNIFENALDDFNVRIQEVPETQSLIDFKTNIKFVDAETDMLDFKVQAQDKYTQITFNDRLFEDMISHMAVQTQQVKPKPKIFEQKSIQSNFQEMKYLTFTRVKVYDNSFLISDYRDKRYKNERYIGLRYGQDMSTTDSRDLHLRDSSMKSNRYINHQDGHMVAVQTQSISVMKTNGIPLQIRNAKLQKDIGKYFQKLNSYVRRDRTKQQQNAANQKLSVPNKKINFKHKSLLHSDSENSIELDSIKTPSYSTNKLKKKFGSSSSLSKNNYRIEIHQSTNPTFKFGQQQLNDKDSKIQSIQEHKYEHLGSKEYEESANLAEKRKIISISKLESQHQKQKFWFMKPQSPLIHQNKEKFLNDLNKGDQLLCKTSIYKKNDAFMESKKILSELDKLSDEIEHTKGSFDLIEESAHESMNLLREELKKMATKNRNNRVLALSRQQSLCRVISFVYTYAYHLYFNHKKELQNLIIPLFHHFKIGYGEIKKKDLYLRMLYFLSQTISHQSQYYIFQSFILFLGLNITAERQLKVCHQTTCLYLKLLHKLSINFRFPLSVEQLYTTVQYFDQKCKQILTEQRLQESITEKIIDHVKLKLRSVNQQNNSELQLESNEFGETKLNVFKCCELIIEEIEKIKSSIEESYQGVLGYFRKEGGPDSKDFITYVINNAYFSTVQYNNKMKYLHEIRTHMSESKFYNKLGKTFMEMRVPTFQKIYYVALAKYKIKEEFLYLSLNRRLSFMMQYLKKHEDKFKTEHVIIDSIISRKDSLVLKEQTTKRMMALAYLRIVQNEANILIKGILGSDLSVFL